jgi:hypothetical protein
VFLAITTLHIGEVTVEAEAAARRRMAATRRRIEQLKLTRHPLYGTAFTINSTKAKF